MKCLLSLSYKKIIPENIPEIKINDDTTYLLTQNIRNFKQLTPSEKLYIKYLDKDNLIKLINIYNDCFGTINEFFK